MNKDKHIGENPLEKIIIKSTQAATSSSTIHVNPPNFYPEIPVTIWCWRLSGDEVIDIQFKTDLAAPHDWVTVHTLTASANQTGIYSPCRFKIKKGITTNDVGVAMSQVRGL